MNKTYMKPGVEVMHIDMLPLMNNSVTTITGLEDVSTSSSEFPGGSTDSRSAEDLWEE